MVFRSCAATALRKREIKPSKSTSVASWVGFTFAGFFSWAVVFLGGVLQPPAARPNNNRTKARNLTPAFIGGTFVIFSREWQVHHYERSQMEGAAPASRSSSTVILSGTGRTRGGEAVGPTPKAFGVAAWEVRFLA